jgi:hypothetical protein
MFDFDVVTGPMPDRRPPQGERPTGKTPKANRETSPQPFAGRVNASPPERATSSAAGGRG